MSICLIIKQLIGGTALRNVENCVGANVVHVAEWHHKCCLSLVQPEISQCW